MVVTAQNFLDSATTIMGRYSCEMDGRNAASRAYYCAYHLAIGAVPYLPKIEDDRMGEHKRLISAFERIAPPHAASRDCKLVGHLLRQLRKIRVEADYDLSHTFRRVDAETALNFFPRTAAKIAEAIEELAR